MFGCFANKEQTICQAFSALKWKLAASLSLSAILKNSALKLKLHIYIIIIIIFFPEKKDFRISYVSDHPSFLFCYIYHLKLCPSAVINFFEKREKLINRR